jgi:uncharacterized protein (TIGR03067 family)
MKRLAVAVLAAGLVGVAAAQEPEKELKRIEGAYTLKALKKDGMDAPKEVMDSVKGVTIKGDKMTIQVRGEDKTATLKIDPAKKPAHIDLTPQDGPEKDKTFPGIYQFEKGELTIVFVEEGERPKDFKAEGDKTMKIVLTRKEKGDK